MHDWNALLTAATGRVARLIDEVDLTASVPACPEWCVADLVEHLREGHLDVQVVLIERAAHHLRGPLRQVGLGNEPLQELRRCAVADADHLAGPATAHLVAQDFEIDLANIVTGAR